MKILKKVVKANRVFREKGLNGVRQSLRRINHNFTEKKKYQLWIKAHRLTDEDRREIRRQIETLPDNLKISVLMPVYNVDEKWLRLCIESVINQLYENWELCIADDCSPLPHIKRVLEEYAARDKRVKIVLRRENGHISAASNSALALATGEFTALLDHDDELSEDALFYVAKEINDFPETRMIYSDEDLIDEKGRRYEPKFKPDWSRDLFYSLNLITHLSVYETDLLRKIGGFRLGAEGSQDYDLALRFTECISDYQIRHIPKILYHWRAIRGSVAFSLDEKPYAHERAREALRAHFDRTGKKAIVSQAIYNLHRVQYELPANLPNVSLILSADSSEIFRKAAESFAKSTDYANLQIISTETRDTPRSEAERLNDTAARADGQILCFIDANLTPLSDGWLKELVGFATQNEIGAVGAKILSKDENILHGGLIIGTSDTISAAHRGMARDYDGYFLRARLTNNFSAISASCLVVRREVYREIDGFDGKNLPDSFFDADFCLKLREKNYRIVFTPYAELIKVDENRRLNLEKNPTAAEKRYFVEKWNEVIDRDPFYNPNLSKKNGGFSIEI